MNNKTIKVSSIFLLTFLTLTPFHSSAQLKLIWAERIGSVGKRVVGNGVCTDNNDNVYTCGYFTGTQDFDPGPGVHYEVSPGNTFTNIFIQKLDAAGHFLWSRNLGVATGDTAYSICTDTLGNSYTVGTFSGDVDFNPSATDSFVMHAIDGKGFMLKLDSNGQFIWAKQWNAKPRRVCYDPKGSILMNGIFGWPMSVGTSTDFDPGPGTYTLSSNGSADVFVLKLTMDGLFSWARGVGGTEFENSGALTCDKQGNVYFSGDFAYTVDFDPGPGVHNMSSTTAGTSNPYDMYLEKLDSSGNFLWVDVFGNSGHDWINDVTTDSLGQVYATGRYWAWVDFDPGPGYLWIACMGFIMNFDSFVLKLHDDGSLIWVRRIGNDDWGDTGLSIDVDERLHIYTAGYFTHNVDFDPSTSTSYLDYHAGSRYIQELDSAGQLIHIQQIGDTSPNIGYGVGYADIPFDACLDKKGNYYMTGYSDSIADFDPGPALFTLPHLGNRDSYTLKCKRCIASNTYEVAKACNHYLWHGTDYIYSGTYPDSLISVDGCDSIAHLQLYLTYLNDTVQQTGNLLTASTSSPTALFQWVNCHQAYAPITGATNASYTPSSVGSFAVIIQDNGCTDTSVCFTIAASHTNDWMQDENWEVYPNPSASRFQIRIPLSNEAYTWKVFDSNGRLVMYNQEAQYTSNFTLQLTNQSPGLYWLEIKKGPCRKHLKLSLTHN